ncbi:sensor histidine kinase [Streptomyces sp. NPDC001156]
MTSYPSTQQHRAPTTRTDQRDPANRQPLVVAAAKPHGIPVELGTSARRMPSLVGDGLLAVAVTLGNLSTSHSASASAPHGVDLPRILLAVLIGGAMAMSRRWPLPALVAVLLGVGALQAGHYLPPLVSSDGAVQVSMSHATAAVAVFCAALRASRRTGHLIAAGILPLATLAELLAAPHHRGTAGAVSLLMLLATWAWGRLLNARRTQQRDLVERLAATARAEAATAHAAIADERARIARELHDIVAHNVSLMVVQAIAADRVQDRDPTKAHELHKTIETTGRAAVAELRGLVQLLRTDGPAAAPDALTAPQPGTAQLPELITAVQNAGLDVSYTATGTPWPLSAGFELTVYRVIQEALTNSLKHAGRSTVDLSLRWQPHQLTIRVCDHGPAGPGPLPSHSSRSGHGLLGMRERVSHLGGHLHAAPRPAGGFCVHATIPLPAPPSEESP